MWAEIFGEVQEGRDREVGDQMRRVLEEGGYRQVEGLEVRVQEWCHCLRSLRQIRILYLSFLTCDATTESRAGREIGNLLRIRSHF